MIEVTLTQKFARCQTSITENFELIDLAFPLMIIVVYSRIEYGNRIQKRQEEKVLKTADSLEKSKSSSNLFSLFCNIMI